MIHERIVKKKSEDFKLKNLSKKKMSVNFSVCCFFYFEGDFIQFFFHWSHDEKIINI